MKSGLMTPDEMDWLELIDKAYPNIMWRYDESQQASSRLPTPVLRIKRTSLSHFFGLFKKEILYAILNQSRTNLEINTMLSTLGLVVQGQRYFALRGDKNIRQIGGPKGDPASMRALLKIDIFAALILYAIGDQNSLKKLAKTRAEAILTARPGADPSLFAFPVAMDTIQVALPKIHHNQKTIDRLFFEEYMMRAEEICRCIDKSVLSQWYGFGQAAQDMAWRGASKRSILGAAYLADTPYIRSMAMMIADMTGLAPHSADSFIGQYSAFCDMDTNTKAHEHAMDQEFAWIVSQDPVRHGVQLFYEAADRQIDGLAKGKVLGLCADALHVSAKVFADEGGMTRDALDAAKQAFDEQKTINKWEDLNALGEQIVDRTKNGAFTGIRDLKELTTQYAGLNGLKDALDVRLMQTPSPNAPHIAPTFTVPSAAPAPNMPKPAAPQIINMPTMKGPTGMGNAGSGYVPVKTETATEDNKVQE